MIARRAFHIFLYEMRSRISQWVNTCGSVDRAGGWGFWAGPMNMLFAVGIRGVYYYSQRLNRIDVCRPAAGPLE